MNHRYFIRYFLIAAENRLKCLIPTFPLTTDLYYWELMSLSSRCSQIYSHKKPEKKYASPKHKSGPWWPWYSLKSLSWFCAWIPSEICKCWLPPSTSHGLLSLWGLARRWPKPLSPTFISPIYETIKRKHLTWSITYHQDFLLPFLYLLPISLTTVKQLYSLSPTNA